MGVRVRTAARTAANSHLVVKIRPYVPVAIVGECWALYPIHIRVNETLTTMETLTTTLLNEVESLVRFKCGCRHNPGRTRHRLEIETNYPSTKDNREYG
jgi:hypothetical protein